MQGLAPRCDCNVAAADRQSPSRHDPLEATSSIDRFDHSMLILPLGDEMRMPLSVGPPVDSTPVHPLSAGRAHNVTVTNWYVLLGH